MAAEVHVQAGALFEASGMSQQPSTFNASGWTLAVGESSSASAALEEAHVVYKGDAFDRPGRGVIAAVARGIGSGPRAREAAHIALHSLVEGYFGAAGTLGPARAASLALASANAWMFSQSHADPTHGMAAAVTALIFVGRRVRIVHVGDCRVYRKRGAELAPLTSDHVLPAADGSGSLTRSVGGDAELQIDYVEDAPEPADRYVILSQGGVAAAGSAQLAGMLMASGSPGDVACAITEAIPGGVTAIVVDVLRAPDSSFGEMAAAFQRLPLRGVPRDGENWDGFLLGRTLYRSRYTTLKLARDTLFDRDVVLKIPLPSMLHDEVFRAGFLREAWVGATVHSARIASYIEVAPSRRSSLYLVLPYYRGETLESRLSGGDPVRYLDGVGLALKLCAAVQDLAALQIVHRDLKPENILLLADGEIKLLDLGLAYLPGVDEPDDDRLGGTTRYMAPELFRKTPADQCSEVFSVGVTVYRLFSGGPFPFGQRETIPLQRLRPDLPAWLGQCLARAMDNNRDRRFADAGQFATALEHGLRQGAMEPLAGLPRRRIDALLLWQSLAGLFAATSLVLLAILLRR
ncbi:bifunctional protein-serine/threonine kinase/phosphatase [Bradyrhizobium sp.]|uniref:bifunctional protein-serine/threonine kinase/phosphatase n=1 Tax=Bradyrhizobium sp. TaxID=376 RepID=UPI003C69F546